MADTPLTLQDALRQYNREDDNQAVASADQERQELVNRFPRDDWLTMPLARYALGQDNSQETFCWSIEFGAAHAGWMGGESARKHLIYKQRDGSWYFDRKLYSTETEAWEALRAGFNEAFQKAAGGDWDAIDQIAVLEGAAALRTKALYCYFPNELLPIYSITHIRHFLRRLSGAPADDPGNDLVRLNRNLLDHLRTSDGLGSWRTKDLERFLSWWADPRQRLVLKIAPGENARFWEDCRNGRYICLGWDAVGDLRLFPSWEEFRARFKEEYGSRYKHHQPQVSRKAGEVWRLRELEPGDLILANRAFPRSWRSGR